MKLTTAEEYASKIKAAVTFAVACEQSGNEAIVRIVRQIQADALRFTASEFQKSGYLHNTAAKIKDLANQLHPLPEAK